MMSDVEKLLFQSDKAELLEWLQAHLPDAEKCFVAIAKKDGDGLILSHSQIGCQVRAGRFRRLGRTLY